MNNEQLFYLYRNKPAPHGYCPIYFESKYIWSEIVVVDYD